MILFEKLKNRWGIQSTWQLIIILVVFGCTGVTVVYAKKFVFAFLGVSGEDPFWFRTLMWLLTILPLYYIFLIAYGAVCGQFQFFWDFTKKMLSRFLPGKNGNVKESEA